MIRSAPVIAVLDACVLYPAPVRDMLLSFAAEGLFMPKWSWIIQDEWIRNLLANRPDLNRKQLVATVRVMNTAFAEANVENFKLIINGINLPDQDDRHVVAAALAGKAEMIITFNRKDFPEAILHPFDLVVKHPDIFLSELYDVDPEKAVMAFQKLINRLRRPPKKATEVLHTLEKCGLHSIAKKFRHL